MEELEPKTGNKLVGLCGFAIILASFCSFLWLYFGNKLWGPGLPGWLQGVIFAHFCVITGLTILHNVVIDNRLSPRLPASRYPTVED